MHKKCRTLLYSIFLNCSVFLTFSFSRNVAFVPNEENTQSVNFHGFGNNGVKPIGMRAFLDSCGLNQQSLWLRSKEFFKAGLLVPRTGGASMATSRLLKMESLYPVSFSRKALSCAVMEGVNLRGSHVLGDDDDVAAWWLSLYKGESQIRGFDICTQAISWTAMVPHSVFVPYLDFDELSPSQDVDQVLAERIVPALDLIKAALRTFGASEQDCETAIFYCSREDDLKLWKHSFHVHFFKIGIENIADFHSLLSKMNDLPRKYKWEKIGEEWKIFEKTGPLIDLAVYGGRNQLFRGPYCGKLGNALARFCHVKLLFNQSRGQWEAVPHEDRASVRSILLSRIAASPSEVKIIQLNSQSSLRPELHSRAEVRENAQERSALFEFASPLIHNFVIPAWQAFRARQLLLHCSTGAGGAVVPTKDFTIGKFSPDPHKVGVFYSRVIGDTFCMFDPSHFHRRSPHTIGIALDMARCGIRQTCFACSNSVAGGTITRPYFNFLHINNEIRIAEKKEIAQTFMTNWEPLKVPHQFVLDYFRNDFSFHRITDRVWVFDYDFKIWRDGSSGNRIAGDMVDLLNTRYSGYLRVVKEIQLEYELSKLQPPENMEEKEPQRKARENKIKKAKTAARKYLEKNSVFIKLAPDTRGKLLDQFKHFRISSEITNFNPYENLVPMKNGYCLNVYNMEISEIRRDHYFTGILNAEYVPEGDKKAVEDWFLEISSGDLEKMRYLKIIAGYMLTTAVHDRKCYVLKGTGKNGKGVFKQFILNILQGPDKTVPRWRSFRPDFWSRKGNSNMGAEQAAPGMFGMYNACVYYTDDMSRAEVDGDKVKTVVAAEVINCRTLYGSNIQFHPTGKVFWTTNWVPDGPGNDNAYWERFVLILFLAKYVSDPSRVNPSKYVFQMNTCKVKELLTMLDAFFTIVIRALSDYYKSLPFNEATNQPAILGSFPIPKTVQEASDEARDTQLPLSSFMREYTRKTEHPLEFVTIEKLFHNYIQFLENANERRKKNETSQISFSKLCVSAMDLNLTATHVEGVALVKTCVPTKEAEGKQPFIVTGDVRF